MGDVLDFPGHARASAGHRSGRSSDRGTPVACSICKTNSAGTPRLERVSQYQTCDCVVPMRSAKGFCPPATSQARFNASTDMGAAYPDLGRNQPKSLCGTAYLNLGKISPMRKVDRKAFGRRARARREKLGLSQEDVGDACGMSQQGVLNIEKGLVERPRRMSEFADALGTTERWLLWREGPETTVIVDAKGQAVALLQHLSDEQMAPVIRLLKTLAEKDEAA